jgi:drug/metabolite transporter (DMT)-like permease
VRRRLDAATILLLTPILWGATFPATKLALRDLPVASFMAWSRGLGVLSILALLPLLRSRDEGPTRAFRDVLAPGVILGALMFTGYVLQTEGQARTTATNAGFITGLYVVFAPILSAVLFRHRVTAAIWLAVAVSVGGLTLLSIQDLHEVRLHPGDLLVLAGSLGWAGHIVAIGHFSPRYPGWMLSVAQMAVATLFHLGLALADGFHVSAAAGLDVWPLLVVTGVIGSGVAFTIQVVAQRTVTPGRAVILLAGESLFAAFFASVWIGERLAAHQWVGAMLVLAAMVFSELAARRPVEERIDPAVP